MIANISGTDQYIENWKSTGSTTFHPLLSEKKFGELWSTNQKVIGAHVDPPNWTFSGDYISESFLRRSLCTSNIRKWCNMTHSKVDIGGAGPSNFLHTLQLPKMYFKSYLGRRAASCWALSHISSFYPRDAMLARVIVIATCPSVCPSVRPSLAGIVSKRRKLAA